MREKGKEGGLLGEGERKVGGLLGEGVGKGRWAAG